MIFAKSTYKQQYYPSNQALNLLFVILMERISIQLICQYVIYCLVTSDGQIAYTKVRTFIKKQPTMSMMYRTITTNGNITIRLTGNHLIYARKKSTEEFSAV